MGYSVKKGTTNSFLFIPTVWCTFNVILAYALSFIAREDQDDSLLVQAEQMIGLMTSTSIGIVTLTFSLTVLSIQIAAQTYSPRLLDEFLRDPVSKVAVATNLGSFAYGYTLTYQIYHPFNKPNTDIGPDGEEIKSTYTVPYVAIHALSFHMVAVLIMFVYFINYFINGFRLETILHRAAEDSWRAAQALERWNIFLNYYVNSPEFLDEQGTPNGANINQNNKRSSSKAAKRIEKQIRRSSMNLYGGPTTTRAQLAKFKLQQYNNGDDIPPSGRRESAQALSSASPPNHQRLVNFNMTDSIVNMGSSLMNVMSDSSTGAGGGGGFGFGDDRSVISQSTRFSVTHPDFICVEEDLPKVPPTAFKVMADVSGYIARYNLHLLLKQAKKLDLCIRYHPNVGEFVAEGTLLAYVWDANTPRQKKLAEKRKNGNSNNKDNNNNMNNDLSDDESWDGLDGIDDSNREYFDDYGGLDKPSTGENMTNPTNNSDSKNTATNSSSSHSAASVDAMRSRTNHAAVTFAGLQVPSSNLDVSDQIAEGNEDETSGSSYKNNKTNINNTNNNNEGENLYGYNVYHNEEKEETKVQPGLHTKVTERNPYTPSVRSVIYNTNRDGNKNNNNSRNPHTSSGGKISRTPPKERRDSIKTRVLRDHSERVHGYLLSRPDPSSIISSATETLRHAALGSSFRGHTPDDIDEEDKKIAKKDSRAKRLTKQLTKRRDIFRKKKLSPSLNQINEDRYLNSDFKDDPKLQRMAEIITEERLGELVMEGVEITAVRSGQLDVLLGVQQLTDVAVKALSAAVNDPMTAIQSLDYLSTLFGRLSHLSFAIAAIRDADGILRACAPRRSFSYLLSIVDGIRFYGGEDLQVQYRLLRFYGDIGAGLKRLGQMDRVGPVLAQMEQCMVVARKSFEAGSLELNSIEEVYKYSVELMASSDAPVLEKGEAIKQDLNDLETTYEKPSDAFFNTLPEPLKRAVSGYSDEDMPVSPSSASTSPRRPSHPLPPQQSQREQQLRYQNFVPTQTVPAPAPASVPPAPASVPPAPASPPAPTQQELQPTMPSISPKVDPFDEQVDAMMRTLSLDLHQENSTTAAEAAASHAYPQDYDDDDDDDTGDDHAAIEQRPRYNNYRQQQQVQVPPPLSSTTTTTSATANRMAAGTPSSFATTTSTASTTPTGGRQHQQQRQESNAGAGTTPERFELEVEAMVRSMSFRTKNNNIKKSGHDSDDTDFSDLGSDYEDLQLGLERASSDTKFGRYSTQKQYQPPAPSPKNSLNHHQHQPELRSHSSMLSTRSDLQSTAILEDEDVVISTNHDATTNNDQQQQHQQHPDDENDEIIRSQTKFEESVDLMMKSLDMVSD